ncbi:hypothetical protein [Bdellovibrio sp. NC01]|uniref:hypothetical protein n=1 Tax=Bdellovibrio sp. NC01 TaxID=2220073 RepID=UPI00115A9788|nr:hypothetical protein [Bdellovibrio sp. NC01]QDK36746.1 hypothetical protein DOE51_03585 [Bdellovibrio sp. NC01]
MKLRSLVRMNLVVLTMILSGFAAHAADDDTNLLIIENPEQITESSPKAEMTDDVQVKFDPSEVTEPEKGFNREAFIQKAQAKFTEEIPKDQLFDFETPRTQAELDKLLQLSDTEIASFLGKKKAFLGKFAKVLSFFRVGPGKINKALNELNGRFYESSHVVSRSNVKGGSMMFSVSGGLALPRKAMEFLRKKSIGNFIPDSGGFYYMLGLGAGFTRQVDSNNKSKFVFEIFMDVEKLKNTLTGIVEVSAAGTYGLVFEKREGPFMTQKNTTMYGGATGVFRQGPHQFGWAASTGLSFPPAIGAFLVYQDHATRFYLFRLEGLKATLPALSLVKDNVLSAFRNIAFNKGRLVRCEKALM